MGSPRAGAAGAFATTIVLLLAGCGGDLLPPLPDAAACGSDCPCSDDTQCAAPTPRCDQNHHRCVACLPGDKTCGNGRLCATVNGEYTCVTGCVVDADCPRAPGGAAMACCGGTCADVTRDVAHCGRCATACPAPAHGSAACVDGACALGSCQPGWGDCDRRAETGCEVDLESDSAHCGGCAMACGALAHAATVACREGACVVGACGAGFGDCDRQGANGCEVDLSTESAHCGACGAACAAPANATASCKAGVCGFGACLAGFADCDAVAGNGCEVPVSGDARNCGACGHACGGPRSVQACQGGACAVTACDAGYADCDKDPDSGCEAQVASDPKHCGGCGVACAAVANGTPGCKNAVCGVGACNFGFADCDRDPVNGCEADLLSPRTCGQCGVACAAPAHASAGCKLGVCGIGACDPLWGDCDGNPGNGCEKSLTVDLGNCGACGKVCSLPNAVVACLNGQCGMVSCKQGFADCNKNAADGCEVNLNLDGANCGACGMACPLQSPYCVGAACTNTTHNIKKFVFDFQGGSGGCGDFSLWYTFNFGVMDYGSCEALANNYGAQFMGQGPGGQIYNYGAPYVGTNRWVGEASVGNGFVGTAGWNAVSVVPKNAANISCVLAYANGVAPGNGTFVNTTVGVNGITYHYNDYGVTSEKTCYTNALAAGARPLNPWTQTLQNPGTAAHMVENHSCHGSTQFCCGADRFASDGGANHNYRCLIGYND